MIKKPWLLLPASLTFKLAPKVLGLLGRFRPRQTLSWSSKTWRGLEFTNPLGLAGGVDKDLEHINAWWSFGVGFIEVGTVTPQPQEANPGETVARNNKHKALWNQLGFPNKGVDHAQMILKQLYKPHFTPIFVNIGKNRNTPNEKAHEDYISCINKLEGLADVFVVNISSPNTESLRELLLPENLRAFLSSVLTARSGKTPVLLKLSPDMNEEQIKSVLDISCELNIDGWVLTNTSTALNEKFGFQKKGGTSGAPLNKRSSEVLKLSLNHLGERRQDKLIVSAGGVMDAQSVFERLEMGADLVQVYSALVFEGPGFFANVADKAATTI